GQFTAAVVVTFFVLLSEFIEAYAVDKGRATIVKLEKSIPRRALVRRDGKEIETAVETIQPGEIVIVRDGERIPVDGNLVKGSGFVNQSAITGEAVAVEKMVGSRVFAGSVDQSGVFEVRTEKVGNETVFGQIIRLVEEAESRKAPIQRISDKLAAWLVEFTIVFAVITFVVTRNLISTISVIVVAGACGVAAGTPLAIVAVMGGLAKKGVIVKWRTGPCRKQQSHERATRPVIKRCRCNYYQQDLGGKTHCPSCSRRTNLWSDWNLRQGPGREPGSGQGVGKNGFVDYHADR